MIEGSTCRILDKTDRGGGIGLGIAINKESRVFSGSEAGGQNHRPRSLFFTPLLVCNRNNSGQKLPRERKSSKELLGMQDVSRGTTFGGGNLAYEGRLFHAERLLPLGSDRLGAVPHRKKIEHVITLCALNCST